MNLKHICTDPMYSTSELCAKLGFGVSVAFLKSCGVSPVLETNTGTWWRQSDFPLICIAIANRCADIGRGQS